MVDWRLNLLTEEVFFQETTQSAFKPDESVEVQTELDSDPFQLGLECISNQLVAEALKEFAQLNCA